jgi:hypothetical protein
MNPVDDFVCGEAQPADFALLYSIEQVRLTDDLDSWYNDEPREASCEDRDQ